MTIQHSVIADADRHEPKGASTATDGQVWVSNGAGSGSFKNTISNVHGQVNINSNTTAKAMTAAVDATLNTDTDYTKMTGVAFPWTTAYIDEVTWNTDEFVFSSPGYYIVSFWGSFKIQGINTFMGVKYAINDTAPYSVQKLVTQASTANDIRSISASSIIGPVNVADTLSIYLASTNSTNITLQDGGLMVAYLHA